MCRVFLYLLAHKYTGACEQQEDFIKHSEVADRNHRSMLLYVVKPLGC